jgi:hypothetical protein
MTAGERSAAGTGSSVIVEHCQVCGSPHLQSVLFLGYLPPVNEMRPIGLRPHQETAYPAEMMYCPKCRLVQIGLIVDSEILFPPDYPYTSGTTKILRQNFAELYRESSEIIPLGSEDLVVDIGSNDGTLLSNFKDGGHRVLGIEPTRVGDLANERGILTLRTFFNKEAAEQVRNEHGPATIVTATNVFAHMENIHQVLEGILSILDERGVFISESHYLMSLIETLQYDTVYHEHLRYYSLHSLRYLFEMHGLDVIYATRIPTHGGSIRVYATRKGVYPVRPSVSDMLAQELATGIDAAKLMEFRRRVTLSKLELYKTLLDIKKKGDRVYGIGAPSRASTLINYVGLDDSLVDCVMEVSGSLKIGKYMPGTLIPVMEESRLFQEQPEYALMLSWHIADELIPKLGAKGFRGKYIVPLPHPRIVGAS